MVIDLREFNPKTASQEQWQKYHSYRLLRHEEVNHGDEFNDNDLIEKMLKQDNPMAEELRFHAYDNDKLIGSLTIGYLKEGTETYENNKHLIQATAALLPEYRGNGYGDLYLQKVFEIAKQKEKTLLITETSEDSGIKYLKKIGAQFAMEGAENRLDFTSIDWDMVQEWNSEGSKSNPNTELIKFDILPEESLSEFAKIISEIQNQQPLDDLEINEVVITPEILKQQERQLQEMGVVMITMITKEIGGTISGLTQMIKLPGKTKLQQQFTGVQSNHRGRGLGKWLKAAMLLEMRERFPDTKVVSTGNANSNAPMLSINERLGFKKHKGSSNVQIPVDKIEDYLASKSSIAA